MLFFDIFHSIFLKKFNFGNPDILKTNFVSKLNNKNKTKGREVIKCIIKYLGFFLIKIPLRKKNEYINILINSILLKKKH